MFAITGAMRLALNSRLIITLWPWIFLATYTACKCLARQPFSFFIITFSHGNKSSHKILKSHSKYPQQSSNCTETEKWCIYISNLYIDNYFYLLQRLSLRWTRQRKKLLSPNRPSGHTPTFSSRPWSSSLTLWWSAATDKKSFRFLLLDLTYFRSSSFSVCLLPSPENKAWKK